MDQVQVRDHRVEVRHRGRVAGIERGVVRERVLGQMRVADLGEVVVALERGQDLDRMERRITNAGVGGQRQAVQLFRNSLGDAETQHPPAEIRLERARQRNERDAERAEPDGGAPGRRTRRSGRPDRQRVPRTHQGRNGRERLPDHAQRVGAVVDRVRVLAAEVALDRGRCGSAVVGQREEREHDGRHEGSAEPETHWGPQGMRGRAWSSDGGRILQGARPLLQRRFDDRGGPGDGRGPRVIEIQGPTPSGK